MRFLRRRSWDEKASGLWMPLEGAVRQVGSTRDGSGKRGRGMWKAGSSSATDWVSRPHMLHLAFLGILSWVFSGWHGNECLMRGFLSSHLAWYSGAALQLSRRKQEAGGHGSGGAFQCWPCDPAGRWLVILRHHGSEGWVDRLDPDVFQQHGRVESKERKQRDEWVAGDNTKWLEKALIRTTQWFQAAQSSVTDVIKPTKNKGRESKGMMALCWELWEIDQ